MKKEGPLLADYLEMFASKVNLGSTECSFCFKATLLVAYCNFYSSVNLTHSNKGMGAFLVFAFGNFFCMLLVAEELPMVP